jgi:uncharacterized protein YcbK (DUF882 family)
MKRAMSRRGVLTGLGVGAAVAATGGAAQASVPQTLTPLMAPARERKLCFHNLHTGEDLRECVFWRDGAVDSAGMAKINKVLRDHRQNEIGEMDPALMDLLFLLRAEVGSNEPFHVISGYRSPKTNAMLRGKSGGVAKKSLHMQGKAIDIRLPGTDLLDLHKAARDLALGGVGLYTGSNFIHVDTGRVRYW